HPRMDVSAPIELVSIDDAQFGDPFAVVDAGDVVPAHVRLQQRPAGEREGNVPVQKSAVHSLRAMVVHRIGPIVDIADIGGAKRSAAGSNPAAPGLTVT